MHLAIKQERKAKIAFYRINPVFLANYFQQHQYQQQQTRKYARQFHPQRSKPKNKQLKHVNAEQLESLKNEEALYKQQIKQKEEKDKLKKEFQEKIQKYRSYKLNKNDIFSAPQKPLDGASTLDRISNIKKEFLKDEGVLKNGINKPNKEVLELKGELFETFGRLKEKREPKKKKEPETEDQTYDRNFGEYDNKEEEDTIIKRMNRRATKHLNSALSILPSDVGSKLIVTEQMKKVIARHVKEVKKEEKAPAPFELTTPEEKIKGRKTLEQPRLLAKGQQIESTLRQILLRQDPMITHALDTAGVRITRVDLVKNSRALIYWRSTRSVEAELHTNAIQEMNNYLETVTGRVRYAIQAKLQLKRTPIIKFSLDREDLEVDKVDAMMELIQQQNEALDEFKQAEKEKEHQKKQQLLQKSNKRQLVQQNTEEAYTLEESSFLSVINKYDKMGKEEVVDDIQEPMEYRLPPGFEEQKKGTPINTNNNNNNNNNNETEYDYSNDVEDEDDDEYVDSLEDFDEDFQREIAKDKEYKLEKYNPN